MADKEVRMNTETLDLLVNKLVDQGFVMNLPDMEELREVFGLSPGSTPGPSSATGLVNFTQWLRGQSSLAARLREHLLGATPTDLRWHAPGEQFLDRLSRVISSIETRASQMIENELPPERKERFFVDVISQPWDRAASVIDAELIVRLQRGLLSTERYRHVCETQVDNEPRRTTQNWVSSEKYDDMVGKSKVVHHLPPPPSVLEDLLSGYFRCLDKLLKDSTVDPIVCATIAKIGFNALHPLVDGNGRVQRLLFQLVLFKYGFLPRMNVPVSVIMLQDRTGYEVLQQRHVDQIMAGISYAECTNEEEGDTFQHLQKAESTLALYQYQDYTFGTSNMIKLMQSTLPVIAAKAYFLQRFDWRVDELLKGDALLPARAATKIAKVFKNEGHGMSLVKLARLLFLDGWSIGFKRIWRFLFVARLPDDVLGWNRVQQVANEFWQRSQRRLWIARSGQQSAASATGRVTWVGVSLDNFETSEVALKRALRVSRPGETVVAVHYPPDMSAMLTQDLFPKLADDILADINHVRQQVQAKVRTVVDSMQLDNGVLFRTFLGANPAYKPASALCEDAKVAEVRPYRIYVGYDKENTRKSFADYIVKNAPCDVAIIKGDSSENGSTRWVGISERNFDISGSALVKAFSHSRPGDTVVAVHYPVDPLEEGLSSVYQRHFSSIDEDYLETLISNIESRVMERAERIAEAHCKPGVEFKKFVGERTTKPHHLMVSNAEAGLHGNNNAKPQTIYVGYNRRRDRTNLVDPQKLHDVADYIVRHAPCNVVVVKESQEAMAARIRSLNREQRV